VGYRLNSPSQDEFVQAATPESRKPRIKCEECRLRTGAGFRDFGSCELGFMSGFKEAHEVAWAGELLVRQDQPSRLVATLYSGWAIKHRTLSSGKRQVLSILLPGDLFGLECVYSGGASHSIEAITDVTYCVFDPLRWQELLNLGSLASRLCELQVNEQRHLEERFAATAACPASRSVAHFVLDTHDRLRGRRLIREGKFMLPLSNQQFADAVGLTTVHLHRILRRMREDGIFTCDHRRIVIHDLERLREFACASTIADQPRPLI
jgi:CRP-like cAMP-binding protein